VIGAEIKGPVVSEKHSPIYNEGERSFLRSTLYSVRAQVTGSVQEFISDLRRELHLTPQDSPPWITILPPRPIGTAREDHLFRVLEQVCHDQEPFEIRIGTVDTFVPVSPVVFLRIEDGAARLLELHRVLNAGPFAGHEQWPYLPHLTIARAEREEQALAIFSTARERWSNFQFRRNVLVEYLTLVREGNEQSGWRTVGDDVPLGGRLIPTRGGWSV